MTPALVGLSIFLAYILRAYPIACAVLITAYFMRTQLELWAYRDDFRLTIYSLLNFQKSRFAWCNLAQYMLVSGRPSAAYDVLKETAKQIPEFPTTYYQLYLINRSIDLGNNFDEALVNLEKACRYGQHERWYKELDDFKNKLKAHRIAKFKENASRRKTIQSRSIVATAIKDDSSLCVGAIA